MRGRMDRGGGVAAGRARLCVRTGHVGRPRRAREAASRSSRETRVQAVGWTAAPASGWDIQPRRGDLGHGAPARSGRAVAGPGARAAAEGDAYLLQSTTGEGWLQHALAEAGWTDPRELARTDD